MESQTWDITCSKEIFDKVKSDEAFHGLLSLARFVNALRFCQTAAIDGKNGKQYSRSRSTINSFLFASSVLFEGLLLVEKLNKTYRDNKSFQNGFGKLLRNKKIHNFRNNVLKRARNKFVFHFDKEFVHEALANFDLEKITFASSTGKASGEMYFVLADELSLNYLLQPQENESDDSLLSRYIQVLKDTTALMVEFTESAEILMADILKKKGFTAKVKKQTP